MKILNLVKDKFKNILIKNNLFNEQIEIEMRPLKPEEAIGYPRRDDYPLLQGKEVLVEAEFKNAKGQAFTDEPFDFKGSVKNIFELPLNTNRNRALFISSLNAILKFLNLINGTIHCKNDEPEECAGEVANFLYKKFGKIKIALVGMQPGFAEALIKKFGKNNITILDLNYKNFDRIFNGVKIKNSKLYLEEVLKNNDITLATGSTIVNDTIDNVIKFSKDTFFYGTTIAGSAKLLNIKRLCFRSH